MKQPLYRQAIAHGWHMAWNNKFLWIYGMFAAFLGQMGIVDFLAKIGLATSDVTGYLGEVGFFQTETGTVSVIESGQTRVLLIWLVTALAVIGIGLVFAMVASQGALIHSAAQVANKKKDSLADTGKAWHAGVSHFWRLFTIAVLKKLLIVALAVVVSAAAFVSLENTTVVHNVFFLLVFILASIVGVVVSFLAVYAAAYVVVEEFSLGKSLRGAWVLFVEHWLVSIEVGLLVLLFNLVLMLVALFGFLVFFFPAMLIWFTAIVTGSATLMFLGFVVAVILFTAYLVFIGSVFTVFSTSVWTFLFMKMHKTGIKSRIHHWLSFKRA